MNKEQMYAELIDLNTAMRTLVAYSSDKTTDPKIVLEIPGKGNRYIRLSYIESPILKIALKDIKSRIDELELELKEKL